MRTEERDTEHGEKRIEEERGQAAWLVGMMRTHKRKCGERKTGQGNASIGSRMDSWQAVCVPSTSTTGTGSGRERGGGGGHLVLAGLLLGNVQRGEEEGGNEMGESEAMESAAVQQKAGPSVGWQ